MAILGLRHAALPTRDLARGIAFYRDFLGFAAYHDRDADWAMLECGGTSISLIRTPASPSPPEGGPSRAFHPSHLGITVSTPEEVPALHARLSQAGQSVGKIETHRDGSQGFYALDPDQNQLEIIFIPAVSLKDSSWFPAQEAIIVLAHGSSDPRWRETLVRLTDRFRRNLPPGTPLELAYMEFATPDFGQAAESLLRKDNAIRRVHVLPNFLSSGGHVSKDLPALVDFARQQHPDREWLLHPAIGETEVAQEALMHAALAFVRAAPRS